MKQDRINIGILGGGLSGLCLAYFLQQDERIDSIEILEKEQKVGGLCRSFTLNNTYYDIGPHIIFSKDENILHFMTGLLGDNLKKLKRHTKILFKKNFIKYPFENELSALPEEDRIYCLNTFLNNSYEKYKPENILQFFLSTFGEGITNCYLRPYNEKIWKFDPSLMDTQMVERIPKPPKEDIIKSANGIATEGFLHQLYFYYPQKGGIESLVKAIAAKLLKKVRITTNYNVTNIEKIDSKWIVKDYAGTEKKYDLLISTIPIPRLAKALGDIMPAEVACNVRDLKYNSIIIYAMNFNKDNLGNIHAVNIPDKDIIFHRLCKINFLMPEYPNKNNSTTLLAEITYRKNDLIDKSSYEQIKEKVLKDLKKIGFIDKHTTCNFSDIKRFEFAYVIYDLHHKKNMKNIKNFFENELQIVLFGRFGRFEYLNMDNIISQSKNLADQLVWSDERLHKKESSTV